MMIITVLLDGDAEYTEIDWQVNTKPLIKFTLDRILNVVAIQIDGDELQWVLDRWPQFVGKLMRVQNIVGDNARTIVANISGNEKHVLG